jgi:hypothetical protein
MTSTLRRIPSRRRGPIDRYHLDRFRAPVSVIFGLILLGYSSYATVQYVHTFLLPVLPEVPIFALPLTIWIGVVVTIAITAGEWFTAETRWYWYAIPFVPDVFFTYMFTAPWVIRATEVHSNQATWAGMVAGAVTLVLAVLTAYFGEILLFGPRRQRG